MENRQFHWDNCILTVEMITKMICFTLEDILQHVCTKVYHWTNSVSYIKLQAVVTFNHYAGRSYHLKAGYDEGNVIKR